MAKQEQKTDDELTRVVCRNRKAKHEYDLFDKLECGIHTDTTLERTT